MAGKSFEQILKEFNESQTYGGQENAEYFVNEEEFWRIQTPSGNINPNNPFVSVQILTEITNDVTPIYKWKEFGSFSSIPAKPNEIIDNSQSRNNYFNSMTLEDSGGGYSVNINLKDSEFDELEDALIRSRITCKMVIDEKIASSRKFYDVNRDNKIDAFEQWVFENPSVLSEGNITEKIKEELTKYETSDSAQELSELIKPENAAELNEKIKNMKEAQTLQKSMGVFEFSMADTEIINLRMQFGYFSPASNKNVFEGNDVNTFSKKTHADNKNKIVLKSPVINLYMLGSQFQFTQSGVAVSLKCFSIGKGTIDKAKLVQKNAAVKGAPQQIWWDLGKSLAKASNNQIVFLGSKSYGGVGSYIDDSKANINRGKSGTKPIIGMGSNFYSEDISKSYTKILSEIGSALVGQTISYKVIPANTTTKEPEKIQNDFIVSANNKAKPIVFAASTVEGTTDKGTLKISETDTTTSEWSLVVELKTNTDPANTAATPIKITDDVTSQVNILKKMMLTLGGEPKFEVLPGEVKEVVQYKSLKEVLNEFCNLAPKKYRNKNTTTGLDGNPLEEYQVENQLINGLSEQNTKKVIDENYDVIPLQWMTIEFEEEIDGKKIKKTGIRFYYPERRITQQPFIRLYTWRRSKTSLIKNFNITSDLDFSNMEMNIISVGQGGLTQHTSTSGTNAGNPSALMSTKIDSNKVSLVNYGVDTFQVQDKVQSIIANMNKILAKGTIEIPGDPFFLFDENMNKSGYAIAINVFRNRNIQTGNSFTRERSYLSGFYLITKITHNVSNSGFSTTLDLMKYYPTGKLEEKT